MRFFLAFVLAIGTVGCSVLGTDETPTIQFGNETDRPIMYFAWGRESSNTFDPNPTLPQDEFRDRVVDIGETVEVTQITGWKTGDDVRFFLYTAPTGQDSASFVSIHDATDEELRKADYRVTIERL
jgi:hypothetical protein